MARGIDLDAARKAREEVVGEAPTLMFREQRFVLPRETPFEFGDELDAVRLDPENGRRHLKAALESMLGDQTEAFYALKPSEEDVAELLKGLVAEFLPGEPQASDGSSTNGSRLSKRTSNGSTVSISEASSGVPIASGSDDYSS